MAVEGDVWQSFVSSVISTNSKDSVQSGDVLSPEDAAWVDSCLINDPELSDGSWNALKDALLDILSSESTLHYNSLATDTDGHPRLTDGDFPMSEEAGTAQFPGGTDEDLVPISEVAESAQFPGGTDDTLVPDSEKTQTTKYQGYLRNDILLNHHDSKKDEDADTGVDLGFTNEIESSSGDIFRVWDLYIPAEEDELVKQLEKALEENALLAIPSTPYDLDPDSNDEALGDLIAGISDLSLSKSSG